jgi:imidazolonepropionase-like amidohydrolase
MDFTRLLAIVAGLFNAGASMAMPQVAEVPTAPIAITGVTVIDVIAGAHRTNVTVLIRNGWIEPIAPKSAFRVRPRDSTGRGKFLIPGLWDMHTHHQGTGADSVDLFVAKGIVGTRDTGRDH